MTPGPLPSSVGRARPRATSRVRATGAVLGLTSAAVVLMGWAGTGTADEPEVRPDELAQAGSLPCPEELPIGDDPSGHGFGVQEVADERPTLLRPTEAWVCRYDVFDAQAPSSGGALYEWRRAGQPERIASADLTRLTEALDELVPADRDDGCNADLGPRWMVAYSHDGDLTGVVVDDYGCRDVRLTDDPTGRHLDRTSRRGR